MSKSLVIVESPAKARTIERYLGPEYRVESSIGHVRDLPKRASELPAKYRGRPWARLGVDVEGGFDPVYVVQPESREQIKKLRAALRGADELVLATDEDREGEAIAWHLQEVLRPKVPVRRMVFHEITKSAVSDALASTRDIDRKRVAAQEARRVLDRLYGFEISELLWKKVKPRLSAGRVQSVATRLVVERERERMAFVSAEYWSVVVELSTDEGRRFQASVAALDGRPLASGRDFDPSTGTLKASKRRARLLGEKEAGRLREELPGTRPDVADVRERPFTRRPYAPFITSSLQQEAGRKFGFSAQRTMRVAQHLYQNGYITYMRTDSRALSGQAISAARRQIGELFGAEYMPGKPRFYQSGRNAQEAHEAIRPAGTTFRAPKQVRAALDRDGFRLYELIWKRTLASQMKDARGTTTTVRLATETKSAGPVELAASGRVLHFPGFLRLYVEDLDDPKAGREDEERFLPELAPGQTVAAGDAEAKGHSTQPPGRYTEASLVGKLEKEGVGRPSTYASILQKIINRDYVWKKGSALVPSFVAFAVTRLLEQHMDDLVDYGFTARMETDLDEIAAGDREAEPWLRSFYFGREGNGEDAGRRGLKELVRAGIDRIDPRSVNSTSLGADDEGREVVVRAGRYGPYVQAGDGPRATLKEGMAPDEVSLAGALELLAAAGERDAPLGLHPETGEPIYVRTGRYGDYFMLGEPAPPGGSGKKPSKAAKPRMASLWPSMDRESLTLDEAVLALSFPREIGRHPESGEPVTVQDGRFGPYVRCGKESRSLEGHEQMATLTLDEALALLRQPKRRRGAASVLKELGEHPRSGLALSVKTGRYGPYVTDGQVNATVPKGREPQEVGLEEAVELLAAREAKLVAQGKDPRAPRRRRPARRRPARKKTRRQG